MNNDLRFTRQARLRNSKEFSDVFANPKRVSAPGILIIGIKNPSVTEARLGLVVAKKVLRKAVWRNRIKRIVRESFRSKRPSLGAVDLVFIAKAPIKDMTPKQIRTSLERLWAQISHRLAG